MRAVRARRAARLDRCVVARCGGVFFAAGFGFAGAFALGVACAFDTGRLAVEAGAGA